MPQIKDPETKEEPSRDEQLERFVKLKEAAGFTGAFNPPEQNPDTGYEASSAVEQSDDAGGGDSMVDAPATSTLDTESRSKHESALTYAGYTAQEITEMSDEQVDRLGSRAQARDKKHHELLQQADTSRKGDATEQDGSDQGQPTAESYLDQAFAPVVEAYGDEEAGVMRDMIEKVTSHLESRFETFHADAEARSTGRVTAEQQLNRIVGSYPELEKDQRLQQRIIGNAQMLAASGNYDDPAEIFDKAALLEGLAPGAAPRVDSRTIRNSQPKNPGENPGTVRARTQNEWDREHLRLQTREGLTRQEANRKLGTRPKKES